MIENLISNIKKNGYTKSSDIISNYDIEILRAEILKIFSNHSNVNTHSDVTPVTNSLIGFNENIDLIVEKILNSIKFREIATSLLGKNYKIWDISSRKSDYSDKGLSMHQDAKGQLNFWLLLNDQPSNNGVTLFFKGSHLLPRWAQKVSWHNINISKFFMKPLIGEKGDYAFFINKTWHGRSKNLTKDINYTLGIGLFAEGSKFKPNIDLIKKIDKKKTPELYLRCSLDNMKLNENGSYLVNYSDEKNKKNYCMSIEELNTQNFIKQAKTYLQLFIMEFVFFIPNRILKKIYRK